MTFRFVKREIYRDKETLMKNLQKKNLQEFPESLVVPEGRTNENAVEEFSLCSMKKLKILTIFTAAL